MPKTVIALFIEPPEHISRKILDLQTSLAEITGSTFNLTFPPHITMRSGLEIPAEKQQQVIGRLKEVASRLPKPTIRITRLSYMEKSGLGTGYWIGLDVQKTEELETIFEKLESEFNEFNGFPEIKELKPHLSLVLNDLSKESFEKAKSHLEQQDISGLITEFQVDFLTVFTSDMNRKQWNKEERLAFRNP